MSEQANKPMADALHEAMEAVDDAVTAQAEATVDALEGHSGALEREVGEWKDKSFRLAAELDNMRKRNAAEMESARKFAVQSFVKDLLPVVDNLERALASGSEGDALREGVDMVRGQLVQALARVGVEKVAAEVGDEPHHDLHQVMQVAKFDGVMAGKIGAVMQPGYAMHGRLVRPALVVVAGD